MPRRSSRKPGDLAQLQRVLWRTILEVEALLDTRPPSNDVVLRSAHALAQLAGAYRGILEVVNLDARLTPVRTNNSSALKSLAFYMLQVHAGV